MSIGKKKADVTERPQRSIRSALSPMTPTTSTPIAPISSHTNETQNSKVNATSAEAAAAITPATAASINKEKMKLPQLEIPSVSKSTHDMFRSNPETKKILLKNNLLSSNATDQTDTHFHGLSNFGNTCYANSIIQLLYSCEPFRYVLERSSSLKSKDTEGDQNDGNMSVPQALRQLFLEMSSQKDPLSVVQPRNFITQLKKNIPQFRSAAQQDAHEFLNILMNQLSEAAVEMPQSYISGPLSLRNDKASNTDQLNAKYEMPDSYKVPPAGKSKSWVDDLFSGSLTNEITCLHCQSKTSREEPFMDLSIDVASNTSIPYCLESFSVEEHLRQQNKFFCDACCSLQEADKCMKIKRLPNVFIVHLKRFKYLAEKNDYIKLFDKVTFPVELRLSNTSDDAMNPDRLYELRALVVHVGSASNYGHYITVVRSGDAWVIMDDNTVGILSLSQLSEYFGGSKSQGSAYVLLYEAVDFDVVQFETSVTNSASAVKQETTHQAISNTRLSSAPVTPTIPVPLDKVTLLPSPSAIKSYVLPSPSTSTKGNQDSLVQATELKRTEPKTPATPTSPAKTSPQTQDLASISQAQETETSNTESTTTQTSSKADKSEVSDSSVATAQMPETGAKRGLFRFKKSTSSRRIVSESPNMTMPTEDSSSPSTSGNTVVTSALPSTKSKPTGPSKHSRHSSFSIKKLWKT